MDIAKNFAKVTLSQGYDAADTEVDILPGEGGKLASAAPYNLVWWNATDFPDPADDPVVEIVRVTDRTDDTLTITRAQEGTAASDHNLAGKTYKMIAGLTAKVINQDVMPILRAGDDITGESIGDFYVSIGGGLIALQLVPGGPHAIGDIDANNTGVALIADDALGQVFLRGPLASDQVASASGPVGSMVGKLAVRDGAGDIIGYLPIYGSIT